jgi:transcription elongation factor GreA
LASAKILKKKKSYEVTLGSKVIISKQGASEQHDYTIVGSEETNMLERKLSYISPLGEALMGKKKGDLFTFETPSGKQKYTIISVE